MSKHSQIKKKSAASLRKMKDQSEKITMITCYDGAFASLMNQTDIDAVLVGDSMGNVVLGFDDTIPVTMDMMVHHTAAVSRILQGPLLIADMPFMSYNISVEQALENASRLVQEGGAQAVKLEGGEEILPQVKAITNAGIPVVGHLGLTPQKIHALGGYRVQGRGDEGVRLSEDAKLLEEAGCFALVLELVPDELAKSVTASLQIPTIGIGAGAGTSGQVLVLHDLLGFNDDFKPKFLKTYANLGQIIRNALQEYVSDVKGGSFPAEEHTFKK
ncbi:3-methyl-2-oxobutanoate hydroxymethyltransferase [Pseudobacteriovorax antillogorgiicola]|uniref:3-methyl-2-oxobutanoate hydroxymethyltransferase n=1 Tax=Pseudobacteriovorax antillogorgiicola TaxID=1513793 RepID=UPI001F464E05|nr:3-methyl-2-oxobutanoate hydroxymethyltransferase [Pseudobacteriovorax antillogorgiicola]